GVVRLSPAIVEPLIALSIAYVAIENLVTSELKPWRPLLVFGFGLLHGLGFAGVLIDLGLPRERFLTALLSFNAGVELGQLTVIAGAFLLVGVWFSHRPWYRRRIVLPASLAIAVVGLYWFVQRVFFPS
ncbi:MAG: HupE/UreJ family protein, partial [Thermoanaerobaculia bacterium]